MLAHEASGAVFAQAIRDLYDRDLEALGRAARGACSTRYTWDRALQHQLAAYSALVGVSLREQDRAPARPAGRAHALSA